MAPPIRLRQLSKVYRVHERDEVIVIHRGRLRYDGGLADLAERMAPYQLIG